MYATIYSASPLVRLGTLRSLKKLVYNNRSSGHSLRYAVEQLNAISSGSALLEITLDTIHPESNEIEDLCLVLDTILIGDRFPSLRNVCLTDTQQFRLFPKLCRLGFLKVLSGGGTKE